LAGHHVEVELLASALILHLVDKPNARVDADALERRRVVEREPFLAAILDMISKRQPRRPSSKRRPEQVAGLVQLGERPLAISRSRPVPSLTGGRQRPSRMSSRTASGKGASNARSALVAGRPMEASSDWSKKLLVRV